ncbi:hypothetical protein BDN72DRAFT_526392 [Pluteus cervinus]|uniref:Uncharacterized protein n=1 Tax=Pluteus cervinus TaxID=181527 RepID=A0ACD3A576_9AGAR|nr:hypothetical protein BDN72DRAFT_526392 [Pluteus cervinus]
MHSTVFLDVEFKSKQSFQYTPGGATFKYRHRELANSFCSSHHPASKSPVDSASIQAKSLPRLPNPLSGRTSPRYSDPHRILTLVSSFLPGPWLGRRADQISQSIIPVYFNPIATMAALALPPVLARRQSATTLVVVVYSTVFQVEVGELTYIHHHGHHLAALPPSPTLNVELPGHTSPRLGPLRHQQLTVPVFHGGFYGYHTSFGCHSKTGCSSVVALALV